MHGKSPRELPSDFHCPYVCSASPALSTWWLGWQRGGSLFFEVATVSNGGQYEKYSVTFLT